MGQVATPRITTQPDASASLTRGPMRLPLLFLTATLVCVAGCGDRKTPLSRHQIPTPVTAAAVAAVPGFTVLTATSTVDDGCTSYDLHGTVAGLKAEVEVEVAKDHTATVTETEVEVALAQVSAQARATALKALPNLHIDRVEHEVEVKHGQTKSQWEFTGTDAGKKVKIEVNPDGSYEIDSDSDSKEHEDKSLKD